MSSAVAPVLNSKVSKWIHRQCQGILSGFFLAWGSQSGPETQSELSPTSGRIVSFGSFGFTISSSVQNITGAGFTLVTLCYHPKNYKSIIGSRVLQHGCQKAVIKLIKGVGGAAMQEYSRSVGKIVNLFRPKLQTNMQIKLFLSPQVYILSKLSRCFKIECRNSFSGSQSWSPCRDTKRGCGKCDSGEVWDGSEDSSVCWGVSRFLGNNLIGFVWFLHFLVSSSWFWLKFISCEYRILFLLFSCWLNWGFTKCNTPPPPMSPFSSILKGKCT